ncbi:hypothetical protein NP493_703g01018 [Ridgeia piscesae]|uniref:Uncharacterized protein n=1 Tax=Ridgeia piscesae TaxID=27915 RepID=A0AAD9NPC6_RIDPI|nr:hypothetical protein NP493_703g01018 [Ridgeia piscesae]
MTNMKRCLSDSESEDGFDDLKDGSPSQSCQVPDRKRRRGIIEKRRRDRINSSLSELRRLVPAAFEKQGSAKLEKAEILQMTVDHLKVLHSKAGLSGYNLDTAALAMDYRSVGFRECAAEVARYLVTVEGMDIQDPLRLRLLSHLQCYSAQREVATKAGFQNASWNHVTMTSHHNLNSQYCSAPGGAVGTLVGHASSILPGSQGDQLAITSHANGLSCYADSGRMVAHHHSHVDSSSNRNMMSSPQNMRIPSTGSATAVAPPQVSCVNSTVSSASPMATSVTLPGLPQIHTQIHTQYPISLNMNSMPMLSPSGGHYNLGPSSGLGPASVKPYRPWGSELVY